LTDEKWTGFTPVNPHKREDVIIIVFYQQKWEIGIIIVLRNHLLRNSRRNSKNSHRDFIRSRSFICFLYS
ncbi:hypothetical protein PMAYCL1PPCAC_27534, partial [Pristionchus mayeri]